MEFVLTCQPIIGNADYPQDLYLAHGAERGGKAEVDETAEMRWEQAFAYLRCEIPDSRNGRARAKPMREVTHVADTPGGGKTDGQVQGLPSDCARLFWFVPVMMCYRRIWRSGIWMFSMIMEDLLLYGVVNPSRS